MSFDLLFINGCSHSAGSEIEGSGIGEGTYNRENCFGAKLARKLSVDKINLAYPGGSNDYIANSTMLWCLNNPEKVQKTYFLIHWTGPDRTDFYTKESDSPKYQDWCFDDKFAHIHHDHYCPHLQEQEKFLAKKISKVLFLNETNWEINRFLNIIRTQTLLKSLGAQYSFHNAFTSCIKEDRYKKYHDLIDKNHFHNMTEKDCTFYYWALNREHDIKGQLHWHHKEPAHSDWADFLFKSLFKS